MSIFLNYTKVEADKGLINSRHFMPELLSDEDKKNGILVEFIPEPLQNGKDYKLYCKPSTGELYYEYADTLTQPEVEELKAQNANIIFALVSNGLM